MEQEQRKRQVEVFTAGCPVCEPAIRLVNELAGPDDEVIVHDLHQAAHDKIEQYRIETVPAVVVDGRLAACCEHGGPTREDLEAAGIGQRIDA
jgi:glutaredoxin 3